jgi:hypothetical protein
VFPAIQFVRKWMKLVDKREGEREKERKREGEGESESESERYVITQVDGKHWTKPCKTRPPLSRTSLHDGPEREEDPHSHSQGRHG